MTVILSGKRKIAIASFLVVAILMQLLCDPLSLILIVGEKVEARVGLPLARARWDRQKVTHYKFDIRGYMPLECIIGANIEVEDDIVVKAGKRSDYAKNPLTSLPPAVPGHSFLCDYRNYTIPKLFGAVESILSTSEIAFDPEYGFVALFKFGYSGGQGLLNPRIADCCGYFQIENFQPLDQ